MESELGEIGSLPYLAAGAGPPLLFLGGLSPEAGVEGGRMRALNLAAITPFAAHHRVYFLNRRPELPRGLSMVDLAAEHAGAIRSYFPGPVDVLGSSTGGSIAQQLAADHPEVVRRLVLVSTACRLSTEGRELQGRVAVRIRRGAHRQALALLAGTLVPRWRGRIPAAVLAWTLGPRLFAPPGLDDMATTIEAEDDFDLSRCPRQIQAPTLILVGGEDRFYDRGLFTETARLIPRSRLEVFDGRGHITVTTDKRFVAVIEGFLVADSA